MVGIINSVIAGVFAGMLSKFALSISAYLNAGLGVAVFVVSVVAHSRYQSIKSMEMVKKLEPLFPGKP